MTFEYKLAGHALTAATISFVNIVKNDCEKVDKARPRQSLSVLGKENRHDNGFAINRSHLRLFRSEN